MSEPITVVDVRNEVVPLEADWAVQAQRSAEDHMNRVWAHFHGEEQGSEVGDSPAVGPFDGCQTCEVRETLYAAMPFIEAGLHRDTVIYRSEPPPLVFNLIACPEGD